MVRDIHQSFEPEILWSSAVTTQDKGGCGSISPKYWGHGTTVWWPVNRQIGILSQLNQNSQSSSPGWFCGLSFVKLSTGLHKTRRCPRTFHTPKPPKGPLDPHSFAECTTRFQESRICHGFFRIRQSRAGHPQRQSSQSLLALAVTQPLNIPLQNLVPLAYEKSSCPLNTPNRVGVFPKCAAISIGVHA